MEQATKIYIGIGLLLGGLLFMVRRDTIGFIGGGIAGLIGLGLLMWGWKSE